MPVTRVLVARAREGRDVLIDALRERGPHVDVVALDDPFPELLDEAASRRRGRSRLPALHVPAPPCASTRPPAVPLKGPRLVSIGPATSAVLRQLGAEPDLEADPHTPDGLIAALLADAVSSVA